LVLAATNRPDLLDPALLRPGRFDVHVEIPLPDLDGRKEIFRIGLRGKPVADGVSPDDLAAVTDRFSGAEIQAVCRGAALQAIREVLQPAGPLSPAPGLQDEVPAAGAQHRQPLLTADHLRRALESVRAHRGEM